MHSNVDQALLKKLNEEAAANIQSGNAVPASVKEGPESPVTNVKVTKSVSHSSRMFTPNISAQPLTAQRVGAPSPEAKAHDGRTPSLGEFVTPLASLGAVIGVFACPEGLALSALAGAGIGALIGVVCWLAAMAYSSLTGDLRRESNRPAQENDFIAHASEAPYQQLGR